MWAAVSAAEQASSKMQTIHTFMEPFLFLSGLKLCTSDFASHSIHRIAALVRLQASLIFFLGGDPNSREHVLH